MQYGRTGHNRVYFPCHPVFRRLFCLAMVLMAFGTTIKGAAGGQTPPTAVLVSDFTGPTSGDAKQNYALTIEVRDAVVNELQAAGQSQYRVITRKEIQVAAKTLGMRLQKDPLQPSEITSDDWFRLGREVKANALVTGDVSVINDRKKGSTVTVHLLVRDVYGGEPFNGAQIRQGVVLRQSDTDEEALRRSAADAGQEAVRQMLRRPQITATVVAIRNGVVTLNGGHHEGLKSGDEMNVYRYGPNGAMTLSGRVHVTKVEQSTAEGKVLVNSGIGQEDLARKAYKPTPSGH